VIRDTLEKWYNRASGALRTALTRTLGTVYTRGGLVQLLYVLVVVALMAGFIDAVFFPIPNQAQIVSPGPGAQTIPEAVIDSFVILIGSAGIYIAYISGRQTTKSRMVSLYLGFALILIAISVFMGVYLSILKG
jgi:predicted ABC-type sugar transport system permease subunit